MEEVQDRIRSLPLWRGRIEMEPVGGGITNTNLLVRDSGHRYFVRVGADIPVHGVMRFNEKAAALAAHAAGVGPAVVYSEPGILVFDHIAGETLTAEGVRRQLDRVLALVKRAHREIPKHLRGPVLAFWVFHVVRDYAHTLKEADFRLKAELPRYLEAAERLERAVGPVELVFGHNDLLAANFIDDGARLWLVDWEYAGFNSPLFDLGGLASNNELSEDERLWLLEAYFERPVDDSLRLSAQAMLTASLLREAMWSMVSEIHSKLEFDYRAYTETNLERFERALARFEEMTRS